MASVNYPPEGLTDSPTITKQNKVDTTNHHDVGAISSNDVIDDTTKHEVIYESTKNDYDSVDEDQDSSNSIPIINTRNSLLDSIQSSNTLHKKNVDESSLKNDTRLREEYGVSFHDDDTNNSQNHEMVFRDLQDSDLDNHLFIIEDKLDDVIRMVSHGKDKDSIGGKVASKSITDPNSNGDSIILPEWLFSVLVLKIMLNITYQF